MRPFVSPAVAWAAWELRSIGRDGANLVIRRRWPTGCFVTWSAHWNCLPYI